MRSRLTAVLALLSAATACSDPSGSSTPTIRIQQSDLTLTPCESRQLVAEVNRADDPALRWVSSHPDIASITAAGLATAHVPGTATVTAIARADTTVRSSIQLTVRSDLARLSVSGSAADTIDAWLAEPLTATATWAQGCPATGITLRFSTVLVRGGEHQVLGPAVRVGPAGTEAPVAHEVEVITDSVGRATVSARLGTTEGTYTIGVDAAGNPFTGNAVFSVLAGAAHVAEASPRDTAVYIGAAYLLRDVRIRDRGWNVLRTSNLFTSEEVVATVAGQMVRGESVGRSRILYDDVVVGYVSVVPEGRLALARLVDHSGIYPAVWLMGLDGSGMRAGYTSTRAGFNVNTAPAWHPDGSTWIVTDAMPHSPGRRMMLVDTLGNARPLLADEHRDDAYNGAFAPGGEWVYFSYEGYLYRARSTGESSPEFVSAVEMWNASIFDRGSAPALSPDHRNLVVQDVFGMLHRVDLTSAGPSAMGIRGRYPAWSPDGHNIAYVVDGAIWLMAPDGSGRRALTDDTYSYGRGLNWSPDGRWLVTQSLDTGNIHVIDAVSGLALPLAFTEGLAYPAWRP